MQFLAKKLNQYFSLPLIFSCLTEFQQYALLMLLLEIQIKQCILQGIRRKMLLC